MKCLVTGGAGFIGSHLVDRLLFDGHRVIVLDDLSTGKMGNLAQARSYAARPTFEFEEADIREGWKVEAIFDRYEGFDVVYHLAASSSVRASLDDPRGDASVNIAGLLVVLEACVRAGVGKVVYAASGGTMYGSPTKLPVREDTLWKTYPHSPYGISKKAGVQYLRHYAHARGLRSCSLALANVYGPRQDGAGEAGVVAIFADRMRAGKPCIINDPGTQTRDYVYVLDVVDAFVKAGTQGRGVFNIGTGVERSVLDVFAEVQKALGISQAPFTHGREIPGEVQRIALDPSRAQRQMGWEPTVTFPAGLARFLSGPITKS